ncbi:MAG TPA: GNAT family N-acetyltransferase, partial [Acidimicrobiales bacterium]|nr:GNAT family N-acetyltransferase [Acidimicrobiales bacterium]
VWLATDGVAVVGVMALSEDWIDQLYIDFPWTGQGIGGRLVDVAKERRPAGLQLWTFQSNAGAQHFYERHGFVAVERTDGAANEERQPDVRYHWVGGGRA